MVNIYVARHGQDLDNANGILNGHRNEPLTDLGRQQAKDVANKMSKAGFSLTSTATAAADISPPPSSTALSLSAIYSSPLTRAHDTANIFADILSGGDSDDATPNSSGGSTIEVEVLNDLIERDFGIMAGQPTSSIIEKCGKDHILATEKINYFLDPPGAETFPDLVDRANRLLSHIQKITEKDSDNNASILLVTHGDFGKMIYAAYYNLQWEEVLRQFHFGNSEVILLAKDSPPEKAHVFETLQFNA
eukprot:CAMPEP_0201677486 /NCGR_PEP_ID=MMETSP0494-20130426/44228_1 /ASSEMBLY_ACC=CAM_ASM_000839 /TAXON_ID=420259 /ORGANISM="Thalassiosira gravida, Strain GMp14c1" /LENGTH=247 /DNA_ID=CAMNT_0048160445 /DNA_START=110 /DNA_END=853 /DNA_ORIENTATION=+